MMYPAIEVSGLTKSFTLHTQGGVIIPVLDEVNLTVDYGQCLALHGPSGSGKSTLLRSLYANYKPQAGQIHVRHNGGRVEMVWAEPWRILEVRRRTIGYVSQFLRVIPRVSCLEATAQPLIDLGVDREEALAKARSLLTRLRIPQSLWSLAPATFSGGEQQRVNVARGFIVDYSVLLLDEPTASLDGANRRTVVELIIEAKQRGAAVVGIFHDGEVRTAAADRIYEMESCLKKNN